MGYAIPVNLSVGDSYVASATLLTSNDTQRGTDATWTLKKSIQRLPNMAMQTQLRFMYDVNSGGGGGAIHCQLKKNGVIIAPQVDDAAGVWISKTQDVTMTDCESLDTFELWVYQTPPMGGLIRNFRIYGTVTVWRNPIT